MRRIVILIWIVCICLLMIPISTRHNDVEENIDSTSPVEPSTRETSIPTESETDVTATMVTIDPTENIEPQQWWVDEELDMLAAIIYYEAGTDDCTDRHQQLVGQVVLNRVADNRYPDTIYGVLTDTKYGVQYSTREKVLANIGNRNIIPQRCYDNALVVLNGGVDCPPNVIYQANFKQGYDIYEEHHTSYSISYFCYG